MASEAWDPAKETFGAYLRGKNLHYGSIGGQRKHFKRWDASLGAYEDAIKQGIEPDTTRLEDIQHAVRVSEATGVAYGS